nr:hypothetical protein [Cohaesibacter sp. ES.047]
MLVDESFNAVAITTASLTVERPHPGWSEQDPDQLDQGLRKRNCRACTHQQGCAVQELCPIVADW